MAAANLELVWTPATELVDLVRRRVVSPVEIAEAAIRQLEAENRRLNAVVTPTPERALDAARAVERAVMAGEELGPLAGVPVTIKDLLMTRGVRMTRGSKLYEHFVPEESTPVVERLEAAGALNLGQTNTPEFGWKGATDNRVFGPTRNPWSLEHTSGGSSGGAGAAVAAGIGPIAAGTDGAGSIRIPASFCGIFGIKPSFGRVPVYPASAAEPLSHTGPMTRTVRDAALMLDVIAGPDERDRNSLPEREFDYLSYVDTSLEEDRPLSHLRVAWSADLGYAVVHPEVATLTAAAARRFEELGCVVEAAHPGFKDPHDTLDTLFYGNIGALLAEYLPRRRDDLDPGLAAGIEQRAGLDGYAALRAYHQRAALWDIVRRFFDRYDLLLTPTIATPAFELGIDGPTEIDGRSIAGLRWTPFTYPFNLTGQPAATVPCGFTRDGLPVGLQIVGRRYADHEVLLAAAAFERIAPWADRRPPLLS